MRTQLPLWSIPLLFALLGLIYLVGNLPLIPGIIVALEAVIYSIYLVLRSRLDIDRGRTVANVLSLYPGHLLLLLAVSLVPGTAVLSYLWAIVPVASIGYDLVSLRASGGGRTSTLIGLYCIIWADLFYILERVIAIKRGFERSEEVIAAVAFGAVGILFISLGVYRHLGAGKEG